MKKIAVFTILLTFITICTFPYAGAVSAAPAHSSESIIMVEANSGMVIFEHNADKKMLIASTTKIMTALVVLENCSCDEKVTIKKDYTNIEGSSLYLREGEIFTVQELLYGLMLASGNDAAVALAYHTAGGIEQFAELMNDKAHELGLKNTSFKNPHGLDEDGHYSTAKDLSVIARYAMQNEDFREIVSTKSAVIHERVLVNHNKLLWKYDGAAGIKTGYTMQSGRSLVSFAERDGTSFIIVTINDRDDWDDHMALFNWGFDNYKTENAVDAEALTYEIPVISGESKIITVRPSNDVSIFIEKDRECEICVFLPRFVYAPVQSGDIIGSIQVFSDGELVGETELICDESIQLDSDSVLPFWKRALKGVSIALQ